MNVCGRPLTCILVSPLASFLRVNERKLYKIVILVTTFCIYMTYHLSRRSLSVVKPVLNHKNCSYFLHGSSVKLVNGTAVDLHWCDWEPFKGSHARSLLGTLDLVFLISYSVSMYVNGMIAERMNLRYFLTIGMIFSGICNVLFGMAYFWDIHSLAYFYAIQIITGIAQSTGWPGVLATVANWFGPSKRGLIFGIWNAHINVGNIAGAAIGGRFVDTNWGLSFIIPGIIIASMGIIVFFFLIPKSEEVRTGLIRNKEIMPGDIKVNSLQVDKRIEIRQVDTEEQTTNVEAISIIDALKISGVIEFSLCLLFTKLVSYTFLDWLPYYISQTNEKISSSTSAYLTILFDIGGIVGGIAAGYLADRTGASALTCMFMLLLAIPSLGIYYLWGNVSKIANMGLQFIAGIFVNAPYALITTAVSADLGSKIPSKSALATVTAIIDATGSFGSAIGPTLAGFVSEYGWNYVFILVMLSDLCGLLCLLRIGIKDCKTLLAQRRARNMTQESIQEIIVTRI